MAVREKSEREALMKMPGFTVGVLADSALRMMKLARPICPYSEMKVKLDRDNKIIPVDLGLPPNCQRAGGAWWVDCEAAGHDPYFTNRVWYTTHDKMGVDEDGDTVVVGVKKVKHEERYPNIAQVAIALRINNGLGVVKAIQQKGYKRLADLGYEEVCQMRNCQKSVNPKCKSVIFGDFCSTAHLQLVAADREGVILTRIGTGLDTGKEAQVRQKRAKQLREVVVGATDESYGG